MISLFVKQPPSINELTIKIQKSVHFYIPISVPVTLVDPAGVPPWCCFGVIICKNTKNRAFLYSNFSTGHSTLDPASVPSLPLLWGHFVGIQKSVLFNIQISVPVTVLLFCCWEHTTTHNYKKPKIVFRRNGVQLLQTVPNFNQSSISDLDLTQVILIDSESTHDLLCT